VVIIAPETVPMPRVEDPERIEIGDLGNGSDGIVHVSARFGSMEAPDVPRCGCSTPNDPKA
jgi:KUP system potassium uptake protein